MDCALSDFESSTPPELSWINRKEGEVSLVLEIQTNVLHAPSVLHLLLWSHSSKLFRFLYLRIIVYRPVFTQHCRESFGESLPESVRRSAQEYKRHKQAENALYSSFSHQCSIACIQAAQELIELISVTSKTDATGAWWYNVFCKLYRSQCLVL